LSIISSMKRLAELRVLGAGRADQSPIVVLPSIAGSPAQRPRVGQQPARQAAHTPGQVNVRTCDAIAARSAARSTEAAGMKAWCAGALVGRMAARPATTTPVKIDYPCRSPPAQRQREFRHVAVAATV